MPHYKLRYLDPTNQQEVASPSRIADHNRPWDEEGVLDGMRSSQGQHKLSIKQAFFQHFYGSGCDWFVEF